MQADKLMAALERFFFDIVGSLIPGALLLLGLWCILQPNKVFGFSVGLPTSTADWWLFVAVAFVLGSGLATLGEVVVVRVGIWLVKGWRCLWQGWRCLWQGWRWLRKSTGRNGEEKAEKKAPANTPFVTSDELDQRLKSEPAAGIIAHRFLPGVDLNEVTASELRNVAMTVIADDDKATTVRFMFLSLMSLGAATVTTILTAIGLIFIPSTRKLWVIVLAGAIVWVFIRRRFEFFNRARSLPFYAAAAQIGVEQAAEKPSTGQVSRGVESVYLAGGHRSEWRDHVTGSVPVLTYRNPKEHSLADPRAYTAWDLEGVRRSDVVFAYLERDNPSGYGLAVEVGYAAGLGKHVIFVDGKSEGDGDEARYLQIIHQTANVSFTTLGDAVKYLGKLALLRQVPKEGDIAG